MVQDIAHRGWGRTQVLKMCGQALGYGLDQATGRGGRHSRMQGWIPLPAVGSDLCPDGSFIGKDLSFALILGSQEMQGRRCVTDLSYEMDSISFNTACSSLSLEYDARILMSLFSDVK